MRKHSAISLISIAAAILLAHPTPASTDAIDRIRQQIRDLRDREQKETSRLEKEIRDIIWNPQKYDWGSGNSDGSTAAKKRLREQIDELRRWTAEAIADLESQINDIQQAREQERRRRTEAEDQERQRRLEAERLKSDAFYKKLRDEAQRNLEKSQRDHDDRMAQLQFNYNQVNTAANTAAKELLSDAAENAASESPSYGFKSIYRPDRGVDAPYRGSLKTAGNIYDSTHAPVERTDTLAPVGSATSGLVHEIGAETDRILSNPSMRPSVYPQQSGYSSTFYRPPNYQPFVSGVTSYSKSSATDIDDEANSIPAAEAEKAKQRSTDRVTDVSHLLSLHGPPRVAPIDFADLLVPGQPTSGNFDDLFFPRASENAQGGHGTGRTRVSAPPSTRPSRFNDLIPQHPRGVKPPAPTSKADFIDLLK